MGSGDQRAVTSVIGNVLLVAVVVVVAAVLGTLALGFVDQAQEVPPKSAFEFEYHNSSDTTSFKHGNPNYGSDNLTVRYTHGDTIPSSRVNVTVSGAVERDQNGDVLGRDLIFEPNYAGGGNLFGNTDTVTAGDQYTISDNDFISTDGSGNLGWLRKLDLSEATVTVYWLSDDGQNSAVIGQWTGPEA